MCICTSIAKNYLCFYAKKNKNKRKKEIKKAFIFFNFYPAHKIKFFILFKPAHATIFPCSLLAYSLKISI